MFFLTQFIFYGSTVSGSQISRLKGFRLLSHISEVLRIARRFLVVGYNGDQDSLDTYSVDFESPL
jgi:hypothetical protein